MERQKGKLSEVAGLFLKLGFIAFGGPAAHIAMMENEVVSKRKWRSRQHFLDLVGATNLIVNQKTTYCVFHFPTGGADSSHFSCKTYSYSTINMA